MQHPTWRGRSDATWGHALRPRWCAKISAVQCLPTLSLLHTGRSEIKCSPYTALASICTPILCPIEHRAGITDHQVRKVTWPTSINHGAVIPGNLRGLGWHLKGKDYPDPWLPSDPTLPTDMQSCAWGTKFVTSVVDFAALNGLLHRV